MEKRYQVFISSTKRDLEEVRRKIALALLDDKFIPVGMEQWGATPIDSWSLIKKYIDQCDYYVLVIAGMYGTIFEEKGLSYTECEYDYAVENNVPVLAFLHKDISFLHGSELESSDLKREMLEKFRKKVADRWSIDYWESKEELPRLIGSRLNKGLEFWDRPGWVPGNSISPTFQAEIDAILKPCKVQGIARVVPDGKADSATMSRNLEASKEIRIMVTSGTRFLDGYRRAISKAIAGGANVRVLLPQPESEFVKDVGESEREGVGGEHRRQEIAQEIREAEDRFSEYMAEARISQTPSRPDLGSIMVGYYTTHLRSTLILCDNSWGWLTITLPPLRASETLSLELCRTGGDCLINDCLRHFDRAWKIVDLRKDVRKIE
jgi:hypothetical protein